MSPNPAVIWLGCNNSLDTLSGLNIDRRAGTICYGGGRCENKDCPQLDQAPGGGRVLSIPSDGDDRRGAKIKTHKNRLGFQQNPKKSLDQKLTRNF